MVHVLMSGSSCSFILRTPVMKSSGVICARQRAAGTRGEGDGTSLNGFLSPKIFLKMPSVHASSDCDTIACHCACR